MFLNIQIYFVQKIMLYILVIITIKNYSQTTLKGIVLKDSSNSGLLNVIISIAELNIVTQTTADGFYQLKKLPKGQYTVMYKLLGYQTKVVSINLKDSTLLNIYLNSSFLQVPEIVVYGTTTSDNEKTANTISTIDGNTMRTEGALNLSDGIAKLPGVSQLSTGAGISKPVIRGMYGNRIQTVLYGLRFDNQQWQDEHGLGLSDVGIDRVELIKGAASLLYGSEAMGGVINIIEEKSAPINTIKTDFSTRVFTNTYGNATDIGIKGATQKINWRVRIGEDTHADYSDGNNKRVLNSRFGGYYGKAGFGFNIKKWVSQNNYMQSQNNFGFLMDPIQLLDPPDNRLNRDFERPHHTVNLNIFSSQNTFFLKNSKLKVNVGYQNNNRQEQEGGNKISLNMILNSFITNLVWTKTIKEKTELNIGTQNFYQTNTNIGSRTIIPDATIAEASGFVYIKTNLKHLVLEGGLRYDYRFVQTYSTGLINTDPTSPGTKILPFTNNYNAINGAFGLSYFTTQHWNIKTNFSSGYRSGNLAELSSNGLHEGTYRYEIGNTNLKIEQNACADLLINYKTSLFNASAAAYYNHFFNYIYLAPSNDEYIGFQIFNYLHQDATIKGLELTTEIHPQKINWFNWINTYSYVNGTLNNGNNLPFIAAPKLNSDIKLSFKNNKHINEFTVKPGITYIFKQNRPGNFETETPDYYLVNISASITIKHPKNIIQLSVTGNNLLNNTYYDHLSRFKYYGIYNIGRNVSLNFKIII